MRDGADDGARAVPSAEAWRSSAGTSPGPRHGRPVRADAGGDESRSVRALDCTLLPRSPTVVGRHRHRATADAAAAHRQATPTTCTPLTRTNASGQLWRQPARSRPRVSNRALPPWVARFTSSEGPPPARPPAASVGSPCDSCAPLLQGSLYPTQFVQKECVIGQHRHVGE